MIAFSSHLGLDIFAQADRGSRLITLKTTINSMPCTRSNITLGVNIALSSFGMNFGVAPDENDVRDDNVLTRHVQKLHNDTQRSV